MKLKSIKKLSILLLIMMKNNNNFSMEWFSNALNVVLKPFKSDTIADYHVSMDEGLRVNKPLSNKALFKKFQSKQLDVDDDYDFINDDVSQEDESNKALFEQIKAKQVDDDDFINDDDHLSEEGEYTEYIREDVPKTLPKNNEFKFIERIQEQERIANEEKSRKEKEELQIYKNVNEIALEIKQQLLWEMKQSNKALVESVGVVQAVQLWTNEHQDSQFYKWAREILPNNTDVHITDVASLLGYKAEYINPYQNIIGEIQSGGEEDVEMFNARITNNNYLLPLDEQNHLDRNEENLKNNKKMSTKDGSRIPKSYEKMVDGLNSLMETRRDHWTTLAANNLGDRIDLISSDYAKLFYNLMDILAFSSYYSHLDTIDQARFVENLISFQNKHSSLYGGQFGLYHKKYGFNFRKQMLLIDSKLSSKDFDVWVKIHNEKNANDKFLEEDFYKSIDEFNKKKQIFTLKLEQSVKFFVHQQEPIIEAMIQSYNTNSIDLFNTIEGDHYIKRMLFFESKAPENLTQDQIKEKAKELQTEYLTHLKGVTPTTFMALKSDEMIKGSYSIEKSLAESQKTQETLKNLFQSIAGKSFYKEVFIDEKKDQDKLRYLEYEIKKSELNNDKTKPQNLSDNIKILQSLKEQLLKPSVVFCERYIHLDEKKTFSRIFNCMQEIQLKKFREDNINVK